MKTHMLKSCYGIQKLIPHISAGCLKAERTVVMLQGTYLELWWRCLKNSKEYVQSCRTGIFTTGAAFKTYNLFGNIENLTIADWWVNKGHSVFSESITTLQVKLFVNKSHEKAYEITVNAGQETSKDLCGREFAFWLEQIALLNSRHGLLSDAPLSWPIYSNRISYHAICNLLYLAEIHEQMVRNAPNIRLWQLGEQLRLNPRATSKFSDYPSDVSDKHKVMGQTVSNYLRKAHCLIENSGRGIFPSFGKLNVAI